MIPRILDKTHVMQINRILSVRGVGLALLGRRLVRRFQRLGIVEQVRALGGTERDGVLEQLREV